MEPKTSCRELQKCVLHIKLLYASILSITLIYGGCFYKMYADTQYLKIAYLQCNQQIEQIFADYNDDIDGAASDIVEVESRNISDYLVYFDQRFIQQHVAKTTEEDASHVGSSDKHSVHKILKRNTEVRESGDSLQNRKRKRNKRRGRRKKHKEQKRRSASNLGSTTADEEPPLSSDDWVWLSSYSRIPVSREVQKFFSYKSKIF